MTTDDIKKIAEAYLDKTYPKYRELNPYSVKNKIAEIVEVIEYLTDRYCIVEREFAGDLINYMESIYFRDVNKDFVDRLRQTMPYYFTPAVLNSKDELQYTAQCETCMRKIHGEILEVCKDSSDENRHCKWNGIQDYCLYKIPWDKYPESYWQTHLSPEQFKFAKSLNQNKDK